MALTKLTLQILAKDILENDYTDFQYCPITRALARAGRPDLHECNGIYHNKSGKMLLGREKFQPPKDKLFGMYATKLNRLNYCGQSPIPIEDFEFEIEFEE